VNRIVPRLIRDGKFIRPALGIQAAAKSFQESLGLPKGVAVIGVLPDSPAHQAGLRPFRRALDGSLVAGDIIVALNGKPIVSFDELLTALEQHQAGDTVTLSIRRGDQQVEQTVRLGLPG
jgi:S1-C subfamily serine protease